LDQHNWYEEKTRILSKGHVSDIPAKNSYFLLSNSKDTQYHNYGIHQRRTQKMGHLGRAIHRRATAAGKDS
jgi:hypothetical protein